MKRVCFFARVPDEALFSLVGFYRDDISILKELGYVVTPINKIRDLLFKRFDAYYVWWFGYGIVPTVIARIFRVPVIVTGAIHTENCGSINDWPFLKRVVMKMTMRLADCSVFISHTDFSKLDGFEPRRSEVIPCGLDLRKFHPPRDYQDQKKFFLTISHLTKDNVQRKRIIASLNAFAEAIRYVPNVEYIIIGRHGSGLSDVVNRVRELGIADSVKLVGAVSEHEKIYFLQRALAYLQPSSCEGFGLAILEAKACGAPVITSAEPCIREVNKDSVVYCESEFEIASQLVQFVKDEAYRAHWSQSALRSVERFSLVARKELLLSLTSKLFGY